MATGQFTPGPIHHFVIFRNQLSQPFYLGTAVIAPEPEGEKFKIPIMNDLSGRSVPFQLVQDGESWLVMTTLNRFDLPICRRIRALESGVPGGLGVLGSETGFARGTLSIGISDFILILLNGYATTVAAGVNGGDLENGKLFKTANLRKYKESTAGTRVKEVAMAIECQNIFIPGTRGFSCYSEQNADINIQQLLTLVN